MPPSPLARSGSPSQLGLGGSPSSQLSPGPPLVRFSAAGYASMSKASLMWPGCQRRTRLIGRGWPRLAEARGSLEAGLALEEASGAPAGRGLSELLVHIGTTLPPASAACHAPRPPPHWCRRDLRPSTTEPPRACEQRRSGWPATCQIAWSFAFPMGRGEGEGEAGSLGSPPLLRVRVLAAFRVADSAAV